MRTSAVFCLAGALVGAGLYAGNRAYVLGLGNFTSDPCAAISGSTYLLHAGQNGDCAGYTDGSYVFDPSLAGVEHDIQRENQQVTSQHPGDYVSVVMLLPISTEKSSIMLMPDVLDHLRGAYTAQYHTNRNDINGSSRPYIQLLIGNAGYQATQESEATHIITSTIESQHIAAVTGLGVSLDKTQAAADTLTTARIPVIGSSISSDNFDHIQNLIRVSPSNKDEFVVANNYARKDRFHKAVLVEDNNPNDIYDSNLVTDLGEFRDTNHTISSLEPYDTTYRNTQQPTQAIRKDDADVQTRISRMIPDICHAQPAVVLFAGRGHDLATLVGALAGRPPPCKGTRITIITGDDVVNMPSSPAVNQGLASGVEVDYPALVDKDEWATGTGSVVAEGQQGFNIFESAFHGLFPHLQPTGENLMMSYDATLTAISAIRLTGQSQPTPEEVADELPTLRETHTVLGASGPLEFNAPLGSNPVNKVIPMLRYGQNGVPHFLGLYWPDGSPLSY